MSLYISAELFWFGAYATYDNGTFYWVDGTLVSDGFSNWERGTPPGPEVVLFRLIDYQWGGIDGHHPIRNYYLCEFVL